MLQVADDPVDVIRGEVPRHTVLKYRWLPRIPSANAYPTCPETLLKAALGSNLTPLQRMVMKGHLVRRPAVAQRDRLILASRRLHKVSRKTRTASTPQTVEGQNVQKDFNTADNVET